MAQGCFSQEVSFNCYRPEEPVQWKTVPSLSRTNRLKNSFVHHTEQLTGEEGHGIQRELKEQQHLVTLPSPSISMLGLGGGLDWLGLT